MYIGCRVGLWSSMVHELMGGCSLFFFSGYGFQITAYFLKRGIRLHCIRGSANSGKKLSPWGPRHLTHSACSPCSIRQLTHSACALWRMRHLSHSACPALLVMPDTWHHQPALLGAPRTSHTRPALEKGRKLRNGNSYLFHCFYVIEGFQTSVVPLLQLVLFLLLFGEQWAGPHCFAFLMHFSTFFGFPEWLGTHCRAMNHFLVLDAHQGPGEQSRWAHEQTLCQSRSNRAFPRCEPRPVLPTLNFPQSRCPLREWSQTCPANNNKTRS